MPKKTQKERVIDKLLEEGEVTNFWAIHSYILRLASLISTLRKEGWEINTYYAGVVGDKNCHYKLIKKPDTVQLTLA